MCGLAGVWNPRKPPSMETLARMADALSHRGPDDAGVWEDRATGLGLAHRRLSILDLSAAGHQPMVSVSGRYAIAYNGEIYNYRALRAELEDVPNFMPWRGHSDTEALLRGFDHWGVAETLRRANGMFALAVFDCETRMLTLARDRMGEKPLYFGWVGGTFCFASELKAFAALQAWRPRIEPSVAAQFLRFGYVGGPRSLVAGLYRLPPGSFLELRVRDIESPKSWPQLERRLQRYWSLAEVACAGRRAPLHDETEARERFQALLRESVSLRMVADVPVGAFLSGGIDSSTVVALMQQLGSQPVRSFTIGFPGQAFDEAPYAAAVARHLGTEHTQMDVSASDALAVIPELPALYDEPFADDSQIPTVLLARLARQHVKVVLSGDAGDELFAGYKRYTRILKLWRRTQGLNAPTRHSLAWLTRGASLMLQPLASISPSSFRLARLARRLEASSVDEMRQRFREGMPALGFAGSEISGIEHCRAPEEMAHPLDRILYADQSDYLPDDILVKVDRAAMSCGLETRIPLLDPAIVEFAWSLPLEQIRGAEGSKLPLRRLLDVYVPRALVDRPKRGFGLPMADWLRGPLRPWAESLIDAGRLHAAGVWNAKAVDTAWRAHVSGRADYHAALWNVLMLAAWQQKTGATI